LRMKSIFDLFLNASLRCHQRKLHLT
jgi:hypothetical protein